LLTGSRDLAEYEDDFVKTGKPRNLSQSDRAKLGSNWILGEVSRIMNAENTGIKEFAERVSPEQLSGLIQFTHDTIINTSTAKSVLEEMFKTAKQAAEIIQERGLSQISDTQEIGGIIRQVITNNAQAVADYRAGKMQSLTFLVGQVMKATKGRANPKLANELLQKMLEEG